MTDHLTALSWNVNGLRAAHKKGFLDWLNSASPEFLCLQETKAHVEHLPDEIVKVSWTQGIDDGGSLILGYIVIVNETNEIMDSARDASRTYYYLRCRRLERFVVQVVAVNDVAKSMLSPPQISICSEPPKKPKNLLFTQKLPKDYFL